MDTVKENTFLHSFGLHSDSRRITIAISSSTPVTALLQEVLSSMRMTQSKNSFWPMRDIVVVDVHRLAPVEGAEDSYTSQMQQIVTMRVA